MCTKSLSDASDSATSTFDRKYRAFRIILSLFGMLALLFLVIGCSTDWWVVYFPQGADKSTPQGSPFVVNGHTGLWRSCIYPNETVKLCQSILSEEFKAVPDFLPGLVMTCAGALFVTVAEILLLFHTRFLTSCLPMTSASLFILSGIVSLIGCLFLLLSFSFALPWYPMERDILTDFHTSIDWSFLLTSVGACYSVVFGLFVFLCLRFVKKSLSGPEKVDLEFE